MRGASTALGHRPIADQAYARRDTTGVRGALHRPGRLLAGTRITVLVADLEITVIDRHTGELLRELTLDPTRDFQPRGVPPGPPRKKS